MAMNDDTSERRDDSAREASEAPWSKAFRAAVRGYLKTKQGRQLARAVLDGTDAGEGDEDTSSEDEGDEQEEGDEPEDEGDGIEGVKLADIDSMLADVFDDAASAGDFDPLGRVVEEEDGDDDPRREAARAAGVSRSTAARRAGASAKGAGTGLASAVAAMTKGARSARKGR